MSGSELDVTLPILLRFEGTLPTPRAPLAPLEQVKVVAVAARPVTEDEVAERFAAVLRAAAAITPRARGERVAAGDEVTFDLIAYADGKPLPLGVASGVTLSADEACALPSVGPNLVGLQVGSSARLSGEFPLDYPEPALAGKQAVFLVDVKQSQVVKLPELDTPGAIAALGLGETLDAVMETLVAQLQLEREADTLARRRLAVGEALIRATPFELSRGYLEHEVGRRWLARDGRVLSRRGATEAELRQSYQAWLDEPRLVAEVERDLRLALLVRTLLEEKQVVIAAQALTLGAVSYAAALGATSEQAATDLLRKEDPQGLVANTLFLNAALEQLGERLRA